MDRTLFTEDHEAFRKAFRSFAEREIVPHQGRWREQGQVDREVWRKAGAQGFLCPWLEDTYGGPGADFLCSVVIMEELARVYESGFAMGLHSDIIVPYIYAFGSEEQKQKWLPGCASGELVTAIGMTEPGTGSDLAAVATTAVKDGDDYVLNGSKTFISNGQLCDLVIVVAKTDPDPANAHKGISLFVVEAGRKGFTKGKRLHKMGMASQDTSELFFEDCRVPAANRLGAEGAGFMMLMQKLQQERLCVAIGAVAGAEQVVAFAHLALKDQRQCVELPDQRFSLRLLLRGLAKGRRLHLFNDGLVGRRGLQGELLRKQVVAAVTVGHLHHIAAMAELVDVFFKNDFHWNLQFAKRRSISSANFANGFRRSLPARR